MSACQLARLLVFTWVFGAGSSLPNLPTQALTRPISWKYEEDDNSQCSGSAVSPCGPAEWSWQCSSAAAPQSPINVANAKVADNPKYTAADLQLRCDASCDELDYILNEHTVEVNMAKTCAKTCHATWHGKMYYLEQLQFHSPSEHTVDGGYFPMEAHAIHRSADTDEALVVAVLITVGDKSDFSANSSYSRGEYMDAIFITVPQPSDSTNSYFSHRASKPWMDGASGFNPYKSIIPNMDCEFYYYTGTLTSPPCTRATWLIAPQPIRVKQSTVAFFRDVLNSNRHNWLATFPAITGSSPNVPPAWNTIVPTGQLFSWNNTLGCNNRPIQDVGTRVVERIRAPDWQKNCSTPVGSPFAHTENATPPPTPQPAPPPTPPSTPTPTLTPLPSPPLARSSCVGYACPLGAHLRPNPQDLDCHLPSGCNELDAMLCCDGITTTPCPTTTPDVATCLDFTCPTGMVNVQPVPICVGGQCTWQRCCIDSTTPINTSRGLVTCRDFTCPTGMRHSVESELIHCKNSWYCDHEDVDTCCRKYTVTTTPTPPTARRISTCLNYACPSGFTLRQNPASIMCNAGGCTIHDTDRCCKLADPCGVVPTTTSNFWGNFRRPEVIAGTAIGGAAAAASIIGGIASGIADSKKKAKLEKKAPVAWATAKSLAEPTVQGVDGKVVKSREQPQKSQSKQKQEKTNDQSSENSGGSGSTAFLILGIVAGVCFLGAGLTLLIKTSRRKKKRRRDKGSDSRTLHADRENGQLALDPESADLVEGVRTRDATLLSEEVSDLQLGLPPLGYEVQPFLLAPQYDLQLPYLEPIQYDLRQDVSMQQEMATAEEERFRLRLREEHPPQDPTPPVYSTADPYGAGFLPVQPLEQAPSPWQAASYGPYDIPPYGTTYDMASMVPR